MEKLNENVEKLNENVDVYENKVEDNIILIVSLGRCGSTTLLRILNEIIPNTNICGENNLFIYNLIDFYINLKKTTIKKNIEFKECINVSNYNEIINKNIKPAWYNSYDENEIINNLKFMITKIFKKNENIKLWGFKEIRYFDNSLEKLKYFKELFPQTKFIILLRENILQHSKSGWYKNNKNSFNTLIQNNKNLINFYRNNKDNSFLISLEKLFDEKYMYNLFKFINCEKYYNKEKIRYLLQITRER